MKELSIEEKAKRYDEALSKAKKIIESYKSRRLDEILFYAQEDLQGLFPELKETEDERIRKELIDFLEYYRLNNVLDSKTISLLTDSVAWLEKKDEQNPVEFDDTNAKRMFIKALERVEELNNKGYKLTDCDKNSWWEDFKTYCGYTATQKPADKVEPKFKVGD